MRPNSTRVKQPEGCYCIQFKVAKQSCHMSRALTRKIQAVGLARRPLAQMNVWEFTEEKIYTFQPPKSPPPGWDRPDGSAPHRFICNVGIPFKPQFVSLSPLFSGRLKGAATPIFLTLRTPGNSQDNDPCIPQVIVLRPKFRT